MGTSEETLKIIFTAVDKTKGVVGNIGSALLGIGKFVGTAALAGSAIGIAAIGGALAVSVKEAMEAQEVMAQLENIIKSTGGAAGVTADDASKLADSLMKVTRFSDEQILSAETLLLQFKSMTKEALPQATALTLDLATRLGTDASGAAMLLGKALSSPGEGLLRLKQAGLDLSDAMVDQITAMVEAGDEAGAMKLIMDELQKSVGGAAEAAGSTFAGQLDILKNGFMNVAESVGNVLLPALSEILTEITPLIMDFASTLADFVKSDEFKQWLTNVVAFVKEQAIPAIIDFAKWFRDDLIPALQRAGKWINTYVIPPLKDLWAWIGTNLPPVIAWIVNVFKVTIPEAVAKLRGLWERDFMGVQTYFTEVWDTIKLVFGIFKAAFEGDWSKVGENIRLIVINSWELIKGVFLARLRDIIQIFKDIDWMELGKNIVLGIAKGIYAFQNFLFGAVKALATAALDVIKGILGIHSELKVFEIQVGKNIGLGILKGWKNALTASSIRASISPLLSFSPSMAGTGAGSPSVIINFNSPVIGFRDEYSLGQNLGPIIQKYLRSR